ncbi:MAG: GNAT family N-acetyltransferase [Gammaproteobacteria bacterium]|nr:GNAT family N-acetyltransferase [Gammaproteobacteria bacterium]
MTAKVQEVRWQDHESTLKSIRFEVFVGEQGVPIEEELDGMDEVSKHFIAWFHDKPVGVARLMPSGQIGRMAVLRPHRKQGFGALLLQTAVETAMANGIEAPFLHAQTHALSFYEAYGFVAHGDIFLDAGIEHRAMVYEADTV